MKKILFLLVPHLFLAQDWMQFTDWPATKRDDGVAVVYGNKAYFGTGLQEWNATIDFRVLDLSSLSWTNMQDMPHTKERQYACAFTGSNCFYVTCGTGAGGALNTTYRYDIAANSWSLMASKPGGGLEAPVCMQFGNKIIIAGGKFDNSSPNHEVWEYDTDNNNWTRKNDLPFSPPWRASATTLNGTGYLLGGIDSNSVFRKEFYKYNYSTDQWTMIGQMPAPRGRAYMAMHGTNDRIFVFGGFDSLNTYYNETLFYRTDNNQWLNGNPLPGLPRRGGMSCAANGRFYYVSGLAATGRITEAWTTDVPTAISELKNLDQLKMFRDENILEISSEKTLGSFILVDLQGRTLINSEINSTHYIIDLSSLPQGIYLAKISGADRLACYKIIK